MKHQSSLKQHPKEFSFWNKNKPNINIYQNNIQIIFKNNQTSIVRWWGRGKTQSAIRVDPRCDVVELFPNLSELSCLDYNTRTQIIQAHVNQY